VIFFFSHARKIQKRDPAKSARFWRLRSQSLEITREMNPNGRIRAEKWILNREVIFSPYAPLLQSCSSSRPHLSAQRQ